VKEVEGTHLGCPSGQLARVPRQSIAFAHSVALHAAASTCDSFFLLVGLRFCQWTMLVDAASTAEKKNGKPSLRCVAHPFGRPVSMNFKAIRATE
jgi:hypothetical protein